MIDSIMHRYKAILALTRQLTRKVPIQQLDRISLHLRRNLTLTTRSLCRLDFVETNVQRGQSNVHPTELQVESEDSSQLKNTSVRLHRSDDHKFAVRLKGLPYSATEEEVLSFIGPEAHVREDCLHLTHSFLGTAFVFLQEQTQIEKVCRKHRMFLGNRYIEVNEVSLESAYDEIEKFSENVDNTKFVALRGLPFEATKHDIINFFSDLDVEETNVSIARTPAGYSTGQAYVQFSNAEDASKALTYNKNSIGNRYIEVFPSTEMAHRRSTRRVRDRFQESPHTENIHPGKNTVRMKGLPYNAGLAEIIEFFKPLEASSVNMLKNEWGRPSGEALVKFSDTGDMIEALKKDRGYIGNRYIELIAEV